MRLFHVTIELAVIDTTYPDLDLNEVDLGHLVSGYKVHEISRKVRQYVESAGTATLAEAQAKPDNEGPAAPVEVVRRGKRNEQRLNGDGERITRFVSHTYVKMAKDYEVGVTSRHKGKRCVWLTDSQRAAITDLVRDKVDGQPKQTKDGGGVITTEGIKLIAAGGE